MASRVSCSLGFGALAVVSCGMPNPIDHDLFPPRDETGYALNIDAASSGSVPASATVTSALGCPDDITVLFSRPLQQGGCEGVGCHSPGNTSPDLTSPNPEGRLLDVASRCNGRPYIGADDSFLMDKISAPSPECGAPMPFSMREALSADDRACIMAWIEEVSAP